VTGTTATEAATTAAAATGAAAAGRAPQLPAEPRRSGGHGSGGHAGQVTLAQALNLGMRRALESDPKVLVMGEDVGRLGGVFRVTEGLAKDFGDDRVLDTPLGESGIVGTAIGMAMRGYRPICEIQFDGFVFPAYDQIVTQLARMRTRTAGRVALPVVVRIPFGGGIGSVEHHSESPEAMFAHVPGLTVVACSNPVDAHWMLREAVRGQDPVVFFEPKRLYYQRAPEDLLESTAAARAAETDRGGYPLRHGAVVRSGTDVTLAGYGPTVTTCLSAAAAAAEDGVSVEVVDVRCLNPLDAATVIASVRRTHRLVVVHEAPRSGGIGGEIVARVTEACFEVLEAPPVRVTGFDVPYPPARVESHHLPDIDRVLDGLDRALAL